MNLKDQAVYSDHRYISSLRSDRITNINEKTMTATLCIWAPSDEFLRAQLPPKEFELARGSDEFYFEVSLRYEVCGTCRGKGKVVNPSIDAHGISTEEFALDPDFAEDYFSGVYDIACTECGGKRVVPVLDENANPPHVVKEYKRQEAEDAQEARDRAWEQKMGW